MSSPTGLGIDFGTSHTTAVLRYPDGTASPLLFDGSPLLVSAVYATSDGDLRVGRDAVHSSRIEPARFEPHPKRRIDDGSLLLGESELSIVTVFAAVLRRVRRECVRTAGQVPATTLTHPATWGPARRQVLLDAATEAGLANPRMTAEPVAAAAHFTHRQEADIPAGAAIVVYDFGGGTFDVSVVERREHGFEVLAVDGSGELGGVDLDHSLIEGLGRQFADDPHWRRLLSPQTPEDRRQHRLFIDDVRSAKEQLSRHSQVDLLIPLLEKEVHLTREELETSARPLVGKTVRLTEAVIRAAQKNPGQVKGVFLVGGASRMPLVATELHRATGIAPTVIDQPELVVASGALPAETPPKSEPTVEEPVPEEPARADTTEEPARRQSAPAASPPQPPAAGGRTSEPRDIDARTGSGPRKPWWFLTVQINLWAQGSVVTFIGAAYVFLFIQDHTPEDLESEFLLRRSFLILMVGFLLIMCARGMSIREIDTEKPSARTDTRRLVLMMQYAGLLLSLLAAAIIVPDIDKYSELPYVVAGLIVSTIFVIAMLHRKSTREWFVEIGR